MVSEIQVYLGKVFRSNLTFYKVLDSVTDSTCTYRLCPAALGTVQGTVTQMNKGKACLSVASGQTPFSNPSQHRPVVAFKVVWLNLN